MKETVGLLFGKSWTDILSPNWFQIKYVSAGTCCIYLRALFGRNGSLFLSVLFSVSNNGIGMERVGILAGALCSHNNLTHIHIRYSLLYILDIE